MLLSLGGVFETSASVSRIIVAGGSGNGALMSTFNDAMMARAHIPEALRPMIEPFLNNAEQKAGMTSGDEGGYGANE